MSTDLKNNEFDTPSRDEQAAKEARWNIERANMQLITEGEKDGKLYSLEASLAHHIPEGTKWEVGEFEDVLTPVDNAAYQQPELSPVTGTYPEVAAIAARLNAEQRKMGVVTYIYSPALIEPQMVA